MSKFAAVFSFRSLGPVGVAAAVDAATGKTSVAVPDALDAMLAADFGDASPEQIAAIRSQFEIVESRDKTKVWKRKTISVELEAPEWLAGIPAAAAKLVQDGIQAFCKAEYLDAYADIGAHNWELVESWLNSSGARAASIDKDTLKRIAAMFGEFTAKLANSKKFAGPMSKLVEQRCAVSSFQRNVGDTSETSVNRIEKLLLLFAENIAANQPEDADDVSAVLSLCMRNIEKVRKGEDAVDMAAMLAGLQIN